jgi:integration host factor subunit beta
MKPDERNAILPVQNKNEPFRMIRSELIAAVAEKNRHLTQADVDVIIKTILDEMGRHLSRGDRIEIRGFGSFGVILRPARTGRNPRTGEAVLVPEKRVPHFKSGRELRERVDGGDNK